MMHMNHNTIPQKHIRFILQVNLIKIFDNLYCNPEQQKPERAKLTKALYPKPNLLFTKKTRRQLPIGIWRSKAAKSGDLTTIAHIHTVKYIYIHATFALEFRVLIAVSCCYSSRQTKTIKHN